MNARPRVTTPHSIEDRVRSVLGVDLRRYLPDADIFLDALSARIGPQPDQAALRRAVSPQWIVLAAGRGTRIDPTGRLNKNLDIWIGARNVVQLAMRNLPGDRPPLVVLAPDAARRLLRADAGPHLDRSGLLPDGALDLAAVDFYFRRKVLLAVQPTPDGTGGALRAAADCLRCSDADIVGVGFGDEAFLERRLFLETLAAHIIAGADGTLCGKRPEGVVDKGGLFFDEQHRFCGTKEWYDMTPDEQQWMRDRYAVGKAVTNTGISLFRREAILDRLGRLWLHKGTEYQHVDLFRILYDDGLPIQAHVFEGEIPAGVNRWQNVLDGERRLHESARAALARAGVRVAGDACVTFDRDAEDFLREGGIGRGCTVAGTVHLGADVRVGDYCHIEDVALTGWTTVGSRVRLCRVTARNALVADADDGSPVGAPVAGLATLTDLQECRLEDVVVGRGVRLSRATAHSTVLPPHLRVEGGHWGISRDTALGMPYVGEPSLCDFVPGDYRPGVFTFGEKRDTPEWDALLTHVRRMVREELAPRAARDATTRDVLLSCVDTLLDAQFGGHHLIEPLTPEELWGVIYELSVAVTGTADPYRADKRRSRAEAFAMIESYQRESLAWDRLLRLDVAANLLDFTSARVLAELDRNPDYCRAALDAALDAPLSVDCTDAFVERFGNGRPERVLWLTDNDGETVFDLSVISRLLDQGHAVTVAARSSAASNDAVADDVREAAAHPVFRSLREAEAAGQCDIIGSGSNTTGTNLYRASAEFVRALREADVVVAKGQGNWYTTQGLRRDTFYLLMSKGLTAQRTTGVTAQPGAPADGMIVAFVPADAPPVGTLAERAVRERRLVGEGEEREDRLL
jgi:uncharacterized protein with ATP-grasp and redox domains/bifunctional N-acetylglucosamine-1-phosphate-uridyltransferase/glucosamine-1-phosphate-acetyltransferase GlmU-like protein